MSEPGSVPPFDEATSAVADVASLPLDVVLGQDGSVLGNDSALGNALRRLLRDMERPGEHYAAHGTTP